jgi:hypothetical protein
MRATLILIAWLATLTVGGPGCARVTTRTVRPSVGRTLLAGSFALLVLDNPFPSRAGSGRAADDLLRDVAHKLMRAGVQVRVARTVPPEYAGLPCVVLQLERFRHVRPKDRLWKGGFAGRAIVAVRVRVYTPGQAEPVAEALVDSQTGTHGLAGTDDEAVEAAADAVADFLLR